MKSQTNEFALEIAIEKLLAGISSEELKNSVAEDRAPYSGEGYLIGKPCDFNSKCALDEVRFWDFLESTCRMGGIW